MRIVLSGSQIKKLIAHREPFLLLRHATENVIGKRVTAVARQNDSLIVPSRLHLLEGLGQASALLIRQVRHIPTRHHISIPYEISRISDKLDCRLQMPIYSDKPIPVFAAMRNVKWIPDEGRVGVVTYAVELKRAIRSRFGVVDARAHLREHLLCSAEMTFSFLDD